MSCSAGVHVVPGGVCGQRATVGERKGCGSRQKLLWFKSVPCHVSVHCPLFMLSFLFIFILLSQSLADLE